MSMQTMNVLGKLNVPLASYDMVIPNLSISEMIDQGNYDIVDPYVYNFAHLKFDKLSESVFSHLFLTFFEQKKRKFSYVPEKVNVDELVGFLENKGMRVAGFIELLSFGITHPSIQKCHQVIALKDVIIVNNQKHYPFLTGIMESSDRILGIIPEKEMIISDDISFLVSF